MTEELTLTWIVRLAAVALGFMIGKVFHMYNNRPKLYRCEHGWVLEYGKEKLVVMDEERNEDGSKS